MLGVKILTDLLRIVDHATEALNEARGREGTSRPLRGADGPPHPTTQPKAPRQQATQQHLQQQLQELHQQLENLKQPQPVQSPSLTTEAIASAISTAVSTSLSSTQKPAEDINAQMLTGSEQPKTMADKVLHASVKEAKATAKVQPLLHTYILPLLHALL